MKNITAQYRDLLEGKISKANFMTNVRRLFPDYIGTANNLEDAVSILKGKRILSEDYSTMKDLAGLRASAEQSRKDPKIQSIANSAAQMSSTEDDVVGNAIKLAKADGITDSDDITNIIDLAVNEFKSSMSEGNMQPLTEDKMYYLVDERGDVVDQIEAPDMIAARNHFENEHEGLMTSMTIVPSRPKAMYEDPNTSVEDPGDRAARLAGEDDEEEEYLEFDTVDEIKKALNEAEEKSEGSYKKVTSKEQYSVFNEIDRVNPYEFRKGITIEMGMQYLPTPNYFTTHFNPETLAKATKKVLKNLQKDPAYYTNQISMTTEKRTNMLQKPKELKVGPDGRAKVPGFSDAKSNTETNLSKKEKAKGDPEGVKEMKPSKKSMGGIKIMKTNEKLPKGVELMKEEEKKNVASTIFDLNKVTAQAPNKLLQQIKDETPSKMDKIAKLKEYLKAEVRKMLQEEDPALTKLEKDEENAEKALATVLTKKAAILNKPGTQG